MASFQQPNLIIQPEDHSTGGGTFRAYILSKSPSIIGVNPQRYYIAGPAQLDLISLWQHYSAHTALSAPGQDDDLREFIGWLRQHHGFVQLVGVMAIELKGW